MSVDDALFVVPAWLAAISELVKSLHHVDDVVPYCFSQLPLCDLDCTDGVRLYEMFGAWCVDWEAVPKRVFMPAWRALPHQRRTALLARRKYYAKELHGGQWPRNMLLRDDAEMLAALPDDEVARNLFGVKQCISAAAVSCLQVWARRLEWPDGAWPVEKNPFSRHWAKSESILLYGYLLPDTKMEAMMRLLHGHGCVWDSVEACSFAAKYNLLNCLRFLHQDHGCPWDDTTCFFAALNGQLDCLRYAHEHGCPTSRLRIASMFRRHPGCVDYILKHVMYSF